MSTLTSANTTQLSTRLGHELLRFRTIFLEQFGVFRHARVPLVEHHAQLEARGGVVAVAGPREVVHGLRGVARGVVWMKG